ncbi:MAG: hypothetical protein ACMUFK_03770 [Thermoplasmatota archaeon]
MANQPSEDDSGWKKTLEGLKDPVTIVVHEPQAQNDTLAEFKSRLEELKEAYGQISVKCVHEEGELDDGVKHLVDHFPAFVILDKDGKDHGIRFYGCPIGNIFTSFVTALTMLSSGDHSLEEEKLEEARALDQTDIQVLVTPNAPAINGTIDITQMLAYVNENVKACVIDLVQFPDIAEQYRVLGIPKTIINETQHYTGPFTLGECLEILKKKISDAEE